MAPVRADERLEEIAVADFDSRDFSGRGTGREGSRCPLPRSARCRFGAFGERRASSTSATKARRRPHEFVGAERLFVEEQAVAQTERGIEVAVGAFFRKRDRVDAEAFQKATGDRAVRPRAVDTHRAAIDQRKSPVQRERVAFGVAAEIVVIVENENARARARRAVEVRRRQSADAAAGDHKVEAFAGSGDTARLRPESPSRRRCAPSKLPGDCHAGR